MSHEIHTIDAAGKAPGRLATEVTRILIGKHKASWTPHIDDGDHVQVVNASKMVLTGKKLNQKVYHHHTTYAAGLRQKKMSTVWAEDPGDVLRRAVSRMLPKNKQRNERLKRLVVNN
ncbi:50S ribosomal protein L13 [Patescibacteria group bacterium]|nr:MAG: 50S ribosomal protein L13 [Patescibacteria group bacterium]